MHTFILEKAMPLPPLPLNRLSYQLANRKHHTFKTKWHEIIMQIFGRYGTIENQGMSLNHCFVFNEDIYRLHVMNYRAYLDPIKLGNPFKWLEFLIVAPLELLSFGYFYIFRLYLINIQKIPLTINLLFILPVILGLLSSYVLDLMVNVVTGSLRRFFLAPVRYIIRPAIEMAMKHPKLFCSVVGLTFCITLAFTLLFTGFLPVVLISLPLLAWSLPAKLAAISMTSIWLGAMLTKGFYSIREAAIWISRDKIFSKIQRRLLLKRDQQADYHLNLMAVDRMLSIEELSFGHSEDVPLLIWNIVSNRAYIYGLSVTGQYGLKPIEASIDYLIPFYGMDLYSIKSMTSEEIDHNLVQYASMVHRRRDSLIHEAKEIPIMSEETLASNTVGALRTKVKDSIYCDINWSKGHVQKRVGRTKELTRVLQHVDVDHADIQPLEKTNHRESPEEKAYGRKLRLSYFFGVEAVVCPIKEQSTENELTSLLY